MKIQLIRNATMKLSYAGRTILTDPMLSAKGAFRSFAGKAPNPTVDLAVTIEKILEGVQALIISHLHPDHFDEAAARILPKNIPVFCQPGDAIHLQENGFTSITAIETSSLWAGITITRTSGQHGQGKILERLGNVSGFVLAAAGEPTVYWVGDSIWYPQVADTIKMHKPDIIITHSGGATLPGFEPIVMDGEQTLTAIKAAPTAKIVAIHMESLDHCTVSRAMLRTMADKAGITPERLIIPEDGESLEL